MGLGGVAAVDNVAVINGYPVIFADPATAQDWYDSQVCYNLYDPLVYPTPEGGIRAQIATSWAPVNGDLAHWTFTIRQGIKFHDGTALTAEDVAFSMNRLMAIGKGYSGVMGSVKATAIGNDKVDFVLDKPNAVFPDTLTLFWVVEKKLVMEHLAQGDYGDYGDYGQAWLQTHDAGSGPYMMTAHIPGERLEATRFDDYFLGWNDPYWKANEVPIEHLIFIMATDYSTLMTMVNNGSLDLEANAGWTNDQLKQIMNNKDLRVNMVWKQNLTVWMNTTIAPTDDEHFRKAILYAFDYQALLERYKAFGYSEAGIYLSDMPGYVPVEPQPREQNLDKARQELALSKYANNLKNVTVVFHFCGGLAFEEEIGLELQADLAKLGIKVQIAGPPWPQYSGECSAPDTTPNMSIFLFAPQYPTADYYTYGMYDPHGLGSIFEAHWYFGDDQIIKLLDETRAEPDAAKRTLIYEQLQPLIAAHALGLFPYEKPTPFVSQQYIVGPEEVTEMVGPNLNMRNWRINLQLKQQLRG